MKMKTNLLLFISCILIFSCLTDPVLEKVYPSDLVIPGVGTLKYIRTHWDSPNDKKNKNGTEIYDARLIDNVFWILGDYPKGNNGDTLYKGINRSAAVNIRKVGEYYPFDVYSGILHKGNNIIFYVQDDDINYIARVNRTTLNRQYIKMPDIFDDFPYRFKFYNDDENLIFIYSENYFSYEPEIFTYWKINENCDNFSEITEQEFNDLYTPPLDYVIDDTGRYYRFYEGEPGSESGYIEVSVDNGNTWHYGDMGRNRPVRIIIQNDSIYIFCDRYSEGGAPFGPDYVGGGIHEFKWK